MLPLTILILLSTQAWSAGGGAYIFMQDTVPQDSVIVPEAQPVEVEQDTVPESTAEPLPVESSPPIDTIPQREDPQPRIIYYQSDRDDDRGSVRYEERRGKRVKTLAGTMNHSGGFGAISFKSTSFNDEAMVMAGVRGGWIVNRTLAIGGEGYGIIPTAKLDGIAVDRQVLALGGYGGLFLELILFSNEVVHVTFPVGGGAGWLGYDPVNDGNLPPMTDPDGDGLVDEDVFWYIEPGADIELNVARNFRLAVGASKRFTQDLDIVNTSSDALEKWNFFVTLKIGSF